MKRTAHPVMRVMAMVSIIAATRKLLGAQNWMMLCLRKKIPHQRAQFAQNVVP
jgi:hypothetical protein